MKILLQLIVALLLLAVCNGCGNSSTDILKLVEERDSLRSLVDSTHLKLKAIDELMSTVAMVNSSLDSITEQERCLIVNGPSESPALTKEEISLKLATLKYTLESHRARIAQLEEELEKRTDDSNLQSVILVLKKQLAQKDVQIKTLEEELTKKNSDIKKLNRIIRENNNVISNMESALTHQDNLLNNCYVLVASKKELKAMGVLKGSKLNSDAFDRSKFMKIDIRKFREVSFVAQKPRILTNMPTSSYMIGTNDRKNFTLKINNPTEFWGVTNFLVIQTD